MPSYEKSPKLRLDKQLYDMAVACDSLLKRSKDNTNDVRVIIEGINKIYIEYALKEDK